MADVSRFIKFLQTGELDMTLPEEALSPIIETNAAASQIMTELNGNPGTCPTGSEGGV